jgi:E3 ubiquitin ligase
VYGLMTLLASAVEAGVAATVRGLGRVRARRTVRRAVPQTCADIAQAGSLAGNGAARPIAEVHAQVALGPDGQVTAPLSGIECAWYLVRVRERFRVWRPGPLGPGRVEREITTAQQVSGRLSIRDETGGLRVDSMGAEYFLGSPAYRAFEERAGGDGSLVERLTQVLGVPLRPRHGTTMIGFLVEEWVLREGDDVHLVGQARGEIGEVVLAKPALRPFVIATAAHSPVPTDGGER